MSKNILYKGIDVSYAQGKVDWAKIKNKIDFAIIRCGFGSDYKSQDDAQWLNNVKGCEENGIPYGVYLFSYATTVEKAKSEAKHALRLLEGHTPSLPIFYDLEISDIRNLGKAKILELAKTFCYEIEKAGYVYGTYCNTDWYNNVLTDKWYDTKVKWLAQYFDKVTYKGEYDIWQYTDEGKLDGVNGKVDMNFCYISIEEGDIDGDGKVTAADARKILRISAGLEKVSGQEALNADVNNDGVINAADAREALLIAAGLKG